jgi:branched-chain amino acid transport system permease protein
VLITAIGVSLFLQNIGQLDWMFGTRPQGMPALVPDRVLWELGGRAAQTGPDGTVTKWELPPTPVRLLDVVCGGTAVGLMLLLDRLVYATKLGRAMRAVSFSERNAALMGIPVDKVISFTFVLGAMLAAAAGFLYTQKYPGINQTAAPVWVLLGLKAFVAAVVGGIGNIRGAMLGGLLIGLAEFFTKAYMPQGTQLADVVVFGTLIVVLLVRPVGILGTVVAEKV